MISYKIVPITDIKAASSGPALPDIAAKAIILANEHLSPPITVYPKVWLLRLSLSVRYTYIGDPHLLGEPFPEILEWFHSPETRKYSW